MLLQELGHLLHRFICVTHGTISCVDVLDELLKLQASFVHAQVNVLCLLVDFITVRIMVPKNDVKQKKNVDKRLLTDLHPKSMHTL